MSYCCKRKDDHSLSDGSKKTVILDVAKYFQKVYKGFIFAKNQYETLKIVTLN